MYPRNAASPPRISIGAVVQISDGAVQTAGVGVKVIPQGGSESAGSGTVAYSADGAVLYTPTQGETDHTAVVFVASKTGCIPATITVVTSASATAGYAGLDWGKITAPTTTVALTGTTINTSQVVASVSDPVTVGTNNDKTGYSLAQAFPANFAALGINSSGHVSRVTLVDTTTVNSDMRGTDNAALASAWTATRAGYLDSVLIAANSNRTVQVTGSNHVAADIHELQAGVITAADFSADWFTAAGIAADAVTEIQSGLATSANQVSILDRQGYALAVLAGTIADAQTAAETYQIVIGGSTYTVDFSGLDASGNRGGQTLTKT
jgi:hypothetical protein